MWRLAVILLLGHAAANYPGPVVRVQQGLLEGIRGNSALNNTYFAFLGIPYAKAPVAHRRFKAPELADSWEGTYKASSESSMCPQIPMGFQQFTGDEDCLRLNVFTNQIPKTGDPLKAVMVWIHGGGFQKGSSKTYMTRPDYLLAEDIVFVSFQYRLGVLGFLSLPEQGVPGNNGLKDQVLALKWVQANIDKFGGDPKNVTIFGESAGAASVQYHLLSKMSQGLFSKAISQSGSALNPWAFSKPAELTFLPVKLVSALGNTTRDPEVILQVLRNATAETLVKATEDMKEKFFPTSEADTEQAFLTASPDSLIESGHFHNVPYISGSNIYESTLFINGILPVDKATVDIYVNNLPYMYKKLQDVDTQTQQRIQAQVMEVYFKNDSSLDEGYINVNTDILFLVGIDKTVRAHAVNSTQPVYYYYFQYNGDLALTKLLNINIKKGPTHADELTYIFHTFTTPKLDNSEAAQMLRKMVKMWTAFAKTGSPSTDWEPYTMEKKQYLDINSNTQMAQDLHPQRLSVWQDV